mgnify:FL=1
MKLLLNVHLIFIGLLLTSTVSASPQNGQKYGDWAFNCDNDSSSQVCFIEQSLVSGKENKRRILGVKIGYYQKKVYGNFVLPLGVLLQHGIKIKVDGFEFSEPIKFTYCNEGGCSASFHLDEKMIGMLKQGNKMEITAMSTNWKTFSLPVSLKGFTKAFGILTAE